jgi:hypothetical protein
MDLGKSPAEHIQYSGGNGFYFNSIIEATLRARGIRYTLEDLEDIFRPYLHPRVRAALEMFEHGKPRNHAECNLEDLVPQQRKVHIFDARRLYYLRFARIDSGELGLKHWKFLNVFLCKSRDEIESMIDSMENQLPRDEYATYVYASFGLAMFFPQYLREHPVALDQNNLDEYFTQELCRLNADEDFFLGIDRNEWDDLHPYLKKYAWLYFDHNFAAQTRDEGFSFGEGFSRPPAQRPGIAVEKACELFGITREQFTHMSKKELIRLYRRKAKKMHPDRGGSHEDFLDLSEAYDRLLGMK